MPGGLSCATNAPPYTPTNVVVVFALLNALPTLCGTGLLSLIGLAVRRGTEDAHHAANQRAPTGVRTADLRLNSSPTNDYA
ncbi:hypothetical protein PC117_g19435 [Phytophthora cactorum]|uniref:Uncharacterized protein n=1 Tax=Phytophthora cactorum TaxID=29920 RepID=A0A8T1BXN0_9STRA|nr:hypothetical protein PC117_g19435 [Phytophthora cactorum]KAG3004225.1 hypothetical protein PC120_g18698 [Phytophthora cactorum]